MIKNRVNIKIIFPDGNIYNKIYKIEGENACQIGRRFAHYIIRKVYYKIYPNGTYNNFLEYCGQCTVYVYRV